ncbi:MAG: hypothetical protein IJ111_02220 [Eggerthellaceae bacterium]|nr:hypothetical protein [Eggerthellaceae bacterium]
MLELKRVRVADIYPLEDEYGNKFLSRDYSLEANKKYVRELAASFGPSGEPDEQVKLIRDGDVYRIKAGNSRVMAMRELGTEECWAVIDSDDTVQSVLETTVRTDVKKTYEDIEKSRYIQQLALFGDDQYVSEVSRINIEDAAKMRRGRALAADKADQYTLDRLYAIGEFEGDDDALEQIMGAKETNLLAVVHSLRSKRKVEEDRAAFIRKAEDLHITIEPNTGFNNGPMRYICTCEDPEDMAADYMAASVDYKGIVGVMGNNWSGVYVMFYGEPLSGETEEDRMRAERNRILDEVCTCAEAIDSALEIFIGGNLAQEDGGRASMPALYEHIDAALVDDYNLTEAFERFPEVAKCHAGPIVFAAMFCRRYNSLNNYGNFIAGFTDSWYIADCVKDSVEFIDLAVSDGMDLDEGAVEFIGKVRARIESVEKDGEE